MSTRPDDSDPDEPSSAPIDSEEAFRLLKHRHTVSFLEPAYRRVPIKPDPDDGTAERKPGEVVAHDGEHTPEPQCSCGRSFETIDAAKAHIRRIAKVLSGAAVDPLEIPLRFTDETSRIDIGQTQDWAQTVEVREPAAFCTDRDVYRNSELVLISGDDLHSVAENCPYQLRLDQSPCQTSQDVYPHSSPFKWELRSDLLCKAVRWFDRVKDFQLDELSLWFTTDVEYLVAPTASRSNEATGIIIAGARSGRVNFGVHCGRRRGHRATLGLSRA